MPFSRQESPELFEEVDKNFAIPSEASATLPKQDRILVVATIGEIMELRRTHQEYFSGNSQSVTNIDVFWQNLLNINAQSNQGEYSLPAKMFSTGYMRSHIYFGETVEVRDIINNICGQLKVPVEFVQSPLY